MVVGPDWKGTTPPGIKKVFQSSTQFSVAGYRTQLFNAADLPNVGVSVDFVFLTDARQGKNP
jgi:hypothetical protein